MQTFKWEKSFLTGLTEVDEQHQRLVDLINAFAGLQEAGAEPAPGQIESLFQELLDYASYHFKCEEVLFAEWDLDMRHRDSHVDAHEGFIQQIKQMREEVPGGSSASARQVLAFLCHWLAFHILGTDQFMARQIEAIRRGRSPKEAFAGGLRASSGATALLLRSIDGLFEVLSDRNRKLSDLNRNLEERVQERTKALSDANLELQGTVEKLEAERAESRRLGGELARTNAVLASLAMTDALTGLANRRQAMERIQAEWSKSVRTGQPLSVVMMDADGFKQVNDAFGHDAGDRVLVALAQVLDESFRAYDLVCRLGGDEFLVICPDTPLEGALVTAERCRRRIEQLRIQAGPGEWRGSISAGVAARVGGQGDPEALLKAADEAVYSAKRQGRNRVEVFPPGRF